MKAKYMSVLIKSKNLLIAYVKSCKKNGYLDDKTIKARQKFSKNISELRLAPKLVSTMMELVQSRVEKVKKEENLIRKACLMLE